MNWVGKVLKEKRSRHVDVSEAFSKVAGKGLGTTASQPTTARSTVGSHEFLPILTFLRSLTTQKICLSEKMLSALDSNSLATTH